MTAKSLARAPGPAPTRSRVSHVGGIALLFLAGCGSETATPGAPVTPSGGASHAAAGFNGGGAPAGASSGGSTTGGVAGVLGGRSAGGAGAGGTSGYAGGAARGGATGGGGFVSAGASSGGAAGSGAGLGGAGGVGGSGGLGSGGLGSGGLGGGGLGGGGLGTGGGGAAGAGGAAYDPCPATGACKIMPFGDSITEGFPVSGGYRTNLFRLALADDHSITFVGSASNGPNTVDGEPFPKNHEGHGGYTIEDEPSRGANGIAPLVGPSMSTYKPDIVTLMIGTNDLNGNFDVADAPNRLGALLDSIHDADPDVLIVLAQIVPTRNDGTNQKVTTYNAAIPALVSERTAEGRHLLLVDMYEAFTRDSNYKTALLGDDLHPNQAGYDRMAETWYEALSPYLH